MILDPKESFPLSARQSLIWLDEQLFPNARYHNLVIELDILGPLDLSRFREAWARTVSERDALRIVVDEREPKQTVADYAPPPLDVVNLDSGALSRWLAEQCSRVLPRDRPPWDAKLLRLCPGRHVFYLCQHHILTDGISMMNLIEHLSDRYAGKEPIPFASFRDYVNFEAEYRTSTKHDDDQAYYSRKLASGAPLLRPYGIVHSDRSAAIDRMHVDAGPDLATRLAALGQHDPFRTTSPRLSRLLVMATALSAFLHRVTGNQEVLLALPWNNRTGKFNRTCGLLMEQLFLKGNIEPGETFGALGRSMRTELLEAMRHGRACISARDLAYFTLNMLPPMPSQFADLEAQIDLLPAPVVAGAGAGIGDLRDSLRLVVCDFADQSLKLQFDFHASTFEHSVRERMGRHFVRILDAMAVSLDAKIDAVDLMDDEERRTVVAAARGAASVGPAPDLLDQISSQARRRAGKTAVEGPDVTLTYAELESGANRLARQLRERGVRRESRVGVALPRGAGELVSLLAILKAGGAYVPIDPTHPVDRVLAILEDAEPDVLIAPPDSPLAALLPKATRLLPLDSISRATSGWDDSPLDEASSSSQLAYILFTSGSTGRPKGVEITRGAFANFLRSMAHTPGLSETDRLLAITTTTFDISGLELFLPLWVGATVVIVDRDTASDPRQLRNQLDAGTVDVMQATPATWRLLLEAGFCGTRSLRILCGGEALPGELADRLLNCGAEVWNLYGPTETTVWSTLVRLMSDRRRITIGRPIDRTTIYVLDALQGLVPRGITGELYIGGDGVARGYRGRPELTAERFLPDPFGTPEDRIYRTGDLGRLLDDGEFECLGRIDHQVKIRGFRIELGEIESVLRKADGVEEVVVIAAARTEGDPWLVAYWIGSASRQALLERARAQLPAYMIPGGYVKLDAFPLTTSGKVDRKALPSPEPAVDLDAEKRMPRNDLETGIAAIWSDVLGVGPIGIDEDFFALGGSSVLAIQVRTRLESELKLELTLHAFFESPTIEGMVARPDFNTRVATEEAIAVKLRRGSSGSPTLFCLLGIHLYQDIARSLDGDWTVIGLHVPMHYDPAHESCPSIFEIAKQYVEIIRRHQPRGKCHLLGLCFGGLVAFEAARQLESLGVRVATVTVLDGHLPRAKVVDQLARIRHYARRLIAEPKTIPSFLSIWARRRLPQRVGKLKKPGRVDVAIDGDAVEAAARRYERETGALAARLIVFRAINLRWPAWIRMDPCLGWSGLSPQLAAHEICCEHLDIVREPHVRVVAAVLSQAQRDVDSATE